MSILKSTNIGRCNFEVDLGLSMNWCSCNLGATKPEEAGEYFAWGDTKGYKESEIEGDMFIKKWYDKSLASKIKADLKLKDDAAHKYLNGRWRIPTDKEFRELKANTNQTVEILNGIKGIRFTGYNGNSIFIPFAGYSYEGSVRCTGRGFDCWSLVIDNENGAYLFGGGTEGNTDIVAGSRCFGFSIRAVCNK